MLFLKALTLSYLGNTLEFLFDGSFWIDWWLIFDKWIRYLLNEVQLVLQVVLTELSRTILSSIYFHLTVTLLFLALFILDRACSHNFWWWLQPIVLTGPLLLFLILSLGGLSASLSLLPTCLRVQLGLFL